MRKPISILVAEDDPNDALLLQMALDKADVRVTVHFVCDGGQVVGYLQGAPPFNNRATHPLPNLLLLDLKMPFVTGFDVLEWLRHKPALKPELVVVLSGSTWQADIDRALALGADLYLSKPLTFEQLVGVVERLKKEASISSSACAGDANRSSALCERPRL